MNYQVIEGTNGQEYVDLRTGEILSKSQVNYKRKLHKHLTSRELGLHDPSKCLTKEDLNAYANFHGIKGKKGMYTHCFTENHLPVKALDLLLKFFNNLSFAGHGYMEKKGLVNLQRNLKPLVEQGYLTILSENKMGIRYILTQNHNGEVIMKRKGDNTLILGKDILTLTTEANEFLQTNEVEAADIPNEEYDTSFDVKVHKADKCHRGISAPYQLRL